MREAVGRAARGRAPHPGREPGRVRHLQRGPDPVRSRGGSTPRPAARAGVVADAPGGRGVGVVRVGPERRRERQPGVERDAWTGPSCARWSSTAGARASWSPPAPQGVVVMDYAPQAPFRVALVGGLVLLGLLLLLAARAARRGSDAAREALDPSRRAAGRSSRPWAQLPASRRPGPRVVAACCGRAGRLGHPGPPRPAGRCRMRRRTRVRRRDRPVHLRGGRPTVGSDVVVALTVEPCAVGCSPGRDRAGSSQVSGRGGEERCRFPVSARWSCRSSLLPSPSA